MQVPKPPMGSKPKSIKKSLFQLSKIRMLEDKISAIQELDLDVSFYAKIMIQEEDKFDAKITAQKSSSKGREGMRSFTPKVPNSMRQLFLS